MILKSPLRSVLRPILAAIDGLWGLFPGYSFRAPLTNSLVLDRGTGTPTFTRADATACATHTDFEGVVRVVPANCARFQGARLVKNLFNTQTDSPGSTGWTVRGGTAPTIGQTDPFGGTKAVLLNTTSGDGFVFQSNNLPSSTYVISCWLKAGTATTAQLCASNQSVIVNLTNEWKRFQFKGTGISTYNGLNQASIIGTYYAYGIQIEDVTGQTNQNPSEYVSVGVLAAPYQGAGVDGLQFFSTLNPNQVSGNVVTSGTGAAINASRPECANGVLAKVVD